MPSPDDPSQPLLGVTSAPTPLCNAPVIIAAEAVEGEGDDGQEDKDKMLDTMSRRSQWIVLAVASGACAAFNGVFAKL